jgi:hypothetical protein
MYYIGRCPGFFFCRLNWCLPPPPLPVSCQIGETGCVYYTERRKTKRYVDKCCPGGAGVESIKTTAKKASCNNYFVPHISFFSIMLASITYSVTSPVVVVYMLFYLFTGMATTTRRGSCRLSTIPPILLPGSMPRERVFLNPSTEFQRVFQNRSTEFQRVFQNCRTEFQRVFLNPSIESQRVFQNRSTEFKRVFLNQSIESQICVLNHNSKGSTPQN